MISAPAIFAYIALGANLGDRLGNIRAALDRLDDHPKVTVKKVSCLLENPAVGGPADSPAFLNGVAEIDTSLEPGELLRLLLDVEKQLGRQRDQCWAPRTIDLDLLLYGDRIIEQPGVSVPHPRMHERRFVLEPLAQIAPNVVHPILRSTARQLLARLDAMNRAPQ